MSGKFSDVMSAQMVVYNYIYMIFDRYDSISNGYCIPFTQIPQSRNLKTNPWFLVEDQRSSSHGSGKDNPADGRNIQQRCRCRKHRRSNHGSS